jgi:hypothetical protein
MLGKCSRATFVHVLRVATLFVSGDADIWAQVAVFGSVLGSD